MKKRFFAVFSLILAAVFLVACSSQSTGEKNWEKIEKRGSIKVATAGTLYPQSYHDDKNNLTGYDVEILKEVGKRLKLKIEFTEMGVDGMLTAVIVVKSISPTTHSKTTTRMSKNSCVLNHTSIHSLLW